MAALICCTSGDHHLLDRGERTSAGVDCIPAVVMMSQRRDAQLSSWCMVGFTHAELQRGWLFVESFRRVDKKVSQFVLHQLRQGSVVLWSTSGCSMDIWKRMTSWSEPVGFSSSTAHLDTSLATAGVASMRSRTEDPVPFL
jgi:hypothetical protein